MTYKYLTKNHLLKIFLLNFFILFISFNLFSESFTEIYRSNYKDNEIQAEYRYDDKGHKIKQEEYKDKNKIRITTYGYNNDGLVDTENIYNVLNKQSIS